MRRRLLMCLLVGLALIAVTIADAMNRTFRVYVRAPSGPLVSAPQPEGPFLLTNGMIPGPASPHVPQAQGMGAITGRVVGSNRRPVYGALVEVEPEPLTMGLTRNAGTNKKGAFIIRDLEAGRYKVYASKEESGYAKTWDHFYSAGLVKISEVTVISGHKVSCGDIHLGPKAGTLVGSFRDATTKKRIVFRNATPITLRRLSDPNNFQRYGGDIDGNFKILVPPVPFVLEVIAPSYEKKDLSVLRLRSGEIKRLDIYLNPAK